jgi:hypothetical protein
MRLGRGRELGLCLLGGLGLALLQWWPMFRAPLGTGFGDWQMVHHNWEAAYVAVSRFGEWPLWDPFHCGGVPILGNPESQVYSPWFLLSFVFGTVIAVKLMVLGHVACAAAGMYWLARRRYELRAEAAALAAIAWSCCGCFVWDAAGGHATFLSFAFAPWLTYLIHRGEDLVREAAAVGALLLLTLVEGGTYPLPFFLIWTVFELSVRAAARKDALSSIRFAAISYSLLAVCGAIRFVPIYFALKANPRQVPNQDALSLSDIWTMLTARSHPWRVPGHPFVWAEYGSYVGPVVVIMALIGLALVLRQRRWHLVAGLALFASLMLGNVGDFAPYSLLHHLPVYDSLRVPSRFAIFLTFYLALLAAHALDLGLRRLQTPRLATSIGVLFAAGVCCDLIVASWPETNLWTSAPLSEEPAAQAFHLVARNYHESYASYPRLNLGTRVCYVGGMNWPVSSALWLGARPQIDVPAQTGELQHWERTPNRFRARLKLHSQARLRFNQNAATGFGSNTGTLTQAKGLLALDLPAGEHDLTVRYHPPELLPSAAVSGIGLLGLLALLWRRRSASLAGDHASATAASSSAAVSGARKA